MNSPAASVMVLKRSPRKIGHLLVRTPGAKSPVIPAAEPGYVRRSEVGPVDSPRWFRRSLSPRLAVERSPGSMHADHCRSGR
jgi:hypothetical protein